MAAVLDPARDTRRDERVVLIGTRNVQNRLLAVLIHEQVGCPCEVVAIDQLDGAAVSPGTVALLDIGGISIAEIGRCVQALVMARGYRRIVLFNAEEGTVHRVILPGVDGVFFHDVSPAQLVKGIRAVFGGEYWLPRKFLAAHFERTRGEARAFSAKRVKLTCKEAETLKLIAYGNGNNAIARQLGVSPHTVKTHVYNLFRKLGVKNRVQAVNWALVNAETLETANRPAV